MFKTQPYVSEKIWGYEKWLVSTHAAGKARVAQETEFIGGKDLSRIIGEDYPLLVKLIQADETLSVQVHPDDDYARDEEISSGKTECWYILDAAEGASLICGFQKDYTPEELHRAVEENNVASCLREIPVKKGDFVYIPSGMAHAIKSGIRLLEVQQPCDITYRLHDWGRAREIHVEKALKAVKNLYSEAEKPFSGFFTCQYFTLEQQTISNKGSIKFTLDEAKLSPAQEAGWVCFFVIEGEGCCSSNTGETFNVQKEDTVMVRIGEEITVKGNLSVMKIY